MNNVYTSFDMNLCKKLCYFQIEKKKKIKGKQDKHKGFFNVFMKLVCVFGDILLNILQFKSVWILYRNFTNKRS